MVFVTYCYIHFYSGCEVFGRVEAWPLYEDSLQLLFKVQMATTTLVSSIIQTGMLNEMFAHIPSICTPDAVNGFICPSARVHFNGSILWIVVGPTHSLFWRRCPLPASDPGFPNRVRLLDPPRTENITPKNQPTHAIRELSLDPASEGAGLVDLGACLLCIQMPLTHESRSVVGELQYPMTLSAGLNRALAVGVMVILFGVVILGG